MDWISNIANWKQAPPASVVTIGSFDGVHRGHQVLISALLRQSKKYQVPSVVFTFNPHPVQVLYPERGFVRLFDWIDQRERFAALGVSAVVVESFSKELSQKNAEDFLREYILLPLKPRAIVVGHDFAFGMNRQGGLPLLEKICRQQGIELEVVSAFHADAQPISSTRIREALIQGEPREAQKLLGRPFYLKGIVEKGEARGRTIGVPTANLKPSTDLVPKHGVYACFVYLNNQQMHGQKIQAATNIGVNPTFSEGDDCPIKVESHLLNFSQEIYGEELRVELIEFIRDEKKFPSVAELVAQIHRDIAKAHEILQAEAK